MPEKAALLAILMMERPLCIICLVKKSGLMPAEVEGGACGTSAAVYSLLPQD